jgi:acyl carrier protein
VSEQSTTQEQVEGIVEEYVRTRFRVQVDDDLFSRDVNMWENGYVDSAGVVEMLAFLESRFKIKIGEEAFFDPNFTNIRGISGTVLRAVDAKVSGAS